MLTNDLNVNIISNVKLENLLYSIKLVFITNAPSISFLLDLAWA